MAGRAEDRIRIMSQHLTAIPAGPATEYPGAIWTQQTAADASCPSTRFLIRPLQIDDYKKGFCNVLGQLTTIGEMDERRFQVRFQEIAALQNTYFIRVIEDLNTNRVVATATLLVERKFVHEGGMVGHIEDVVVDKEMRGHDLGKKIIQELMEVGKAAGCYKVILDCSEKNVGFYEKCGFQRKEVLMAWYIPEKH